MSTDVSEVHAASIIRAIIINISEVPGQFLAQILAILTEVFMVFLSPSW
jgi:hypothetical protein